MARAQLWASSKISIINQLQPRLDPELLHQAPGTGRQALLLSTGTRHQAPSTKHQTPSTRHQAPSTKHQVPGTKHQAPGTKHQAPSTKHQAPSTRHQAPGTKHQAPGIWHSCPAQAPGTGHWAHLLSMGFSSSPTAISGKPSSINCTQWDIET